MPPSRSSSPSSFDSSSASDTSQRPPVIAALPPLPLYTIDLSLSPSQRYTRICADFRAELAQFKDLYRSIIGLSGSPRLAGGLARLLLRKVHEREETQEIKAIAKDSGLRLCEVVAYNSFLDMFSGCVSGGVRAIVPSQEPDGGEERDVRAEEEKQTMLHFRNLDWEMDILRDLLIRVEYVRQGRVVARAVTYAGYTGVLTGVREGLSMSLNYRLRIDSRWSAMSHYLHYLAVLLGSRSSTPSQLRSLLISPGPTPSVDDIIERFRNTKTGQCYLTFCSPEEVVILEKDLYGMQESELPPTKDAQSGKDGNRTKDREKKEGLEEKVSKTFQGPQPDNNEHGGLRCGIQRNKEFAVVTNHDLSCESWSPSKWARAWKTKKIRDVGGADRIMGDSVTRKKCVAERFYELKRAGGRVTLEEIKDWLRARPVRNETTHFSCIMDPSAPGGGMVWVEGCETV